VVLVLFFFFFLHSEFFWFGVFLKAEFRFLKAKKQGFELKLLAIVTQQT